MSQRLSVARSLAQNFHLVGALGQWFWSERLTQDSVTIPCIIIAAVNAYVLWNEHWEHWEHMPPLEERVEYPYQNIRTKNYFWGNGDEVSYANY